MIDLIDRDALRSAIEDTDWYHIADNGELVAGANSLKHTPLYKADDVFNAIFDAPSVPVSTWKWIPATDSPKRNGCYIVAVNHWLDGKPVTREAYWNGCDWLSCDKKRELTPRVTHWMPLPQPPKGE